MPETTPVVCPVCLRTNTHFALKVQDHSISKDWFEVWECAECSMRFTKDAPAADIIGPYYKSENYISHSNTRKGIVNTLYHQVRRRTLNSKCELIRKETGKKTGDHLDIGAGTGAFVLFMKEQGWKSTGVEPDETARGIALSEHQTTLLPGGALQTLAPGSFDAITLWHVLEHVHELHPYLQQMHKLLRPGGKLFIAVPNYTSYDAGKYQQFWAAYDVPRHLYHFSPDAMRYLMKMEDFVMEKTEPMWYDSFYISLLSEKYATGHSSLVKGFFTGAYSDIKAMGNRDRCSSLIYISSKTR